MNYPDIVVMQREHEERLRRTPRFVIAETDEGFEVHQWTEAGVMPCVTYPTKQAAAARLLQLLEINHAVIPQSWLERGCIGSGAFSDETPKEPTS